MKSTFSTTILLLFSCILLGQTQPIEKIEVEKDPIIMDAFDYAIGRMNKVPLGFKVMGGEGARLSYEHKIGKAFSINLNSIWFFDDFYFDDREIDNSVELGIRNYIGLSKKVRHSHQGNNLNGKYWELGARANFEVFEFDFLTPYLKLGYQSRFLQRGVIDASLKISYGNRFFGSNGKIDRSLTIRSGFDIGFIFSPKYNLERVDENRCAILKCYDEQTTMLKSRISYLLFLSFSKGNTFISMNPNLELEHKISKVALSLNHEVFFNYFYRDRENSIGRTSNYSAYGVRSSLRWYFLKKRRIAKGKTANNLSGFYFGPVVALARYNNYAEEPYSFYEENGNEFDFGIDVGYQTRLMKNLYFKVNLSYLTTKVFAQEERYSFTRFGAPSGITVGYVF